MAIAVKRRSAFGDLLRDALDERQITIRGLARLLADDDTPLSIESRRRMLQRYIRGDVSPGPEVRAAIADALQVDPERFAEDREHEERRRRLVAALQPLADELLALATEARERKAGA